MRAGTSPVIVVGMHRSGTSALMRVLGLLGVDLGPEEQLMEAKEDNPEGFWENRLLVQTHDDLLARLGGRWDDPPLTDTLTELDDFDEWVTRCRQVVDGFVGDIPGFKDPRASLLLDLWSQIWPDARLVVSLRHPRAVADSLKRRDGFAEEKSALLWLRYTWEALATANNPIVTRFEDLLDDPETTITNVVGALGLEPTADQFEKAMATIRKGGTGGVQAAAPASEAMELATWMYEHLSEIPDILTPVVAAGIREQDGMVRLRQVENDRRRIVEQCDELHDELKKTQADFHAAREEAGQLALLAENRLQALEREERSREALAARIASIEGELATLRTEVEWRRNIQYRFEKVLGRKGLRRLSGYKGD